MKKDLYIKQLEKQNENLREKLAAVEGDYDDLNEHRNSMGQFTATCELHNFSYHKGTRKLKRVWDDYFINELFKIKTHCQIETTKLKSKSSIEELFKYFRYTLFSNCYAHIESHNDFCMTTNQPKSLIAINEDVFKFVGDIEDVAMRSLKKIQKTFNMNRYEFEVSENISHDYTICKGGFEAELKTCVEFSPIYHSEEKDLTIFWQEVFAY